MEKKIMVLIILGLASLSKAQTNPQNIINSKISEGYYALYLTEGAIPAGALRQDQTLKTNRNEAIKQQNTKERNIVTTLAGFGQAHKSKAGLSKKGNETKTCNTRTVYN
ncbi:hypothetical protein HZA73_09900 [candidate division TA06 bacterium]|nr:hypothetical protein [candidate division TA06 bacterium]